MTSNAAYTELVARLNREHGWNLSDAQQQQYITELFERPTKYPDEPYVRKQIQNYHADHNLVRSLSDRDHPKHHTAWQNWTEQVIRILHKNGQHWTRDPSMTFEDLAQRALMALVVSLSSYRYESRFSTWAYKVITASVWNYLACSSIRQASTTESLDYDSVSLQEDGRIHHKQSETPENQAEIHMLRTLVYRVLHEHPDPRMVEIFRLREQDTRLEDIALSLNLSIGRVSVLLKEGRHFLQQHPAIRQWFDE